MEACKEFFHDIQRNLYTMEFREKPFHDIQRNFHTMEFRKETFHEIRINSYIMEAPLKSTLSQPSKYKKPAVILPA